MSVAIVVTYESQDVVCGCITSALEAGVSKVVVWDNSPTTATREAIATMNDCRVEVFYDGGNYGFGGGVNRAFRHALASGPILLLNPDARVSAMALDKLMDTLSSHGNAIVGARMQYPDGTFGIAGGPTPSILKEVAAISRLDDLLPRTARSWLLSRFRSKSGSGASLADSLAEGGILEVDWISGFCMLTTEETFAAVGGFDERYFLYFEDVDFCRRARQAGFDVLLQRAASAIHFESTSTGAHGKSSSYRNGMSTFYSLHGPKWSAAVARMMARLP